jgi:hypothetical protein
MFRNNSLRRGSNSFTTPDTPAEWPQNQEIKVSLTFFIVRAREQMKMCFHKCAEIFRQSGKKCALRQAVAGEPFQSTVFEQLGDERGGSTSAIELLLNSCPQKDSLGKRESRFLIRARDSRTESKETACFFMLDQIS